MDVLSYNEDRKIEIVDLNALQRHSDSQPVKICLNDFENFSMTAKCKSKSYVFQRMDGNENKLRYHYQYGRRINSNHFNTLDFEQNLLNNLVR